MQIKQLANRTTTLLLFGLLVFPPGFAAKRDKDQAFMQGDSAEGRIARDVRHQLLMLPYYGVFDDLAFRVDGGTVTLLGAVVRPTLKSDAERAVKPVRLAGDRLAVIERLGFDLQIDADADGLGEVLH